jgi:hypothetical protein
VVAIGQWGRVSVPARPVDDLARAIPRTSLD